MKYAIIEAGGKQYISREGETIEVDRLPRGIGDKVAWKEVLLLVDDSKVTVGNPYITGASVEGEVVAQIKGPKIHVFKYIPKERYRRRSGHRHQYTRILISKVGLASSKKAAQLSVEEGQAAPLKESSKEARTAMEGKVGKAARPAAKEKVSKASEMPAKEKSKKASQAAAKEKSSKASPTTAKEKSGRAKQTGTKGKKTAPVPSEKEKTGGVKKSASKVEKTSAQTSKK
jgi:large subunit ribosomal protein L21